MDLEDVNDLDALGFEAIETETLVTLTMRYRDLTKVFLTVVAANVATHFGMAAWKLRIDRKEAEENRDKED